MHGSDAVVAIRLISLGKAGVKLEGGDTGFAEALILNAEYRYVRRGEDDAMVTVG